MSLLSCKWYRFVTISLLQINFDIIIVSTFRNLYSTARPDRNTIWALARLKEKHILMKLVKESYINIGTIFSLLNSLSITTVYFCMVSYGNIDISVSMSKHNNTNYWYWIYFSNYIIQLTNHQLLLCENTFSGHKQHQYKIDNVS